MAAHKLFSAILLLVPAQLSASDTTVFKCPNGWKKIYEKCYLFVPYQHTWIEALKNCHRQGAILGEPKGFDSTSKLATEATKLGLQNFWIGYNRVGHSEDTADVGYWSGGNQTGVEVGVWAPYEPQVEKGDCVYIGRPWDSEDDVNRWYIDTCNQVYPSVCERTPCPQDTFSCHNGHCVAPSSVCDGLNTCGDFSDEMNCTSQCTHFETGTSGRIESPKSGSQQLYSSNLNCQWTIQGTNGARIQIQFDKFETETDLDFVELWDGGGTIATSQLVARLSGSSAGQYESYISSSNWLIVRFITDGSVVKSGFSFTWSTDYQCSMPRLSGKALSNPAEGYNITLGSRQTVDHCVTECTRSEMCYGVLYNTNQPGDADEKCFMIMEPLIVVDNDCCDIYVKTCPGETSLATLATVPLLDRKIQAGDRKQFLYTPLYPLPYIGNMELTYTVTVPGTRLITFEILQVELCCSDAIFFYDGSDPLSPLLYAVRQTTEPGMSVVSTMNTVYIHMQLLSHWSCQGAIVSIKSGCAIVFTAVTGVIQSPGYGVRSYPGIATCSWLIKPSTATSIRLVFEDMDLEENKDFLEVYNGTDETGLALHSGRGYSGSTIPVTIVTTGTLYIKLTTSAVGGGRGFKASYSSGCPQLSSLNAYLIPTATTYHAPDIVNMSCVDGYYFTGSHADDLSVVLTCLTSGSWDVNPVPVCERGYCGFAPDLQNGHLVKATGVQGGDTAEYQCDAGYQTNGSTLISCLSNNQWEPLPMCSSPSCPDLTSLYDNVKLILGDGIQHGSVAEVTCRQYYQLIGPHTLECVGGEWKQSLPSCERIPCPVPAIWNAILDPSQDFYISNRIHMSCLPGYVIEGTTDKTETEFSCGLEDAPQCINLDECILKKDACIGATCVDTDGSYRCDCLPGYQPVGASLTECEDIDECAENLAFCDHECTNTQGSYTCSCYDGYDLYTTPNFGDLYLDDGEDGSKPWHNFHVGHSCVLQQCASAPILEIENGQSLTSKTLFFNGDKVEYLCDIGYKITDSEESSEIVSCEDGQWNKEPSCTAVYCTDVTDLEANPAGNIAYGATVQKECTLRNGDVVVLERKCGYNQFHNEYKTAGDDFECPETICGDPPQIKGTATYFVDCVYYNCTFEFLCRSQYRQLGTSSRGDNTVRCTEEGLWDFGDLSCQEGHCLDLGHPENGYTTFSSYQHGNDVVHIVEEGSLTTFHCNRGSYSPEPHSTVVCEVLSDDGQCLDPGHPENGYTTFSSYQHGNDVVYTVEEGSVATFHCNRGGYSPEPHSTVVCQVLSDGTLGWNGTVPTCRDREAPVFESCPDTMFVEQYSSIDYEIPKATDNTALYKFDVSPKNFQPGTVTDTALRVRYTAADYEGMTSYCDIWIYLLDSVPPLIECIRPSVIIAPSTGLLKVFTNTSQFVQVTESDITIEAYQPLIHIGMSMVGRNPVVDYMAIDRSGNTAVCRSQLRIEGPQCDEGDLRFKYENITCSMAGARKNCLVSCLDNYVFFEDPTLSTISLSCENGAWSRNAPICTDLSNPFYSATYLLNYQPVSAVNSDTCVDIYKIQVQNQLVTLVNALESLCQISTPDIQVMQAGDPVAVTIQNAGSVAVSLALEIRPDGLLDSQYSECAAQILGSFFSITAEVQSIEILPGSGVCPLVKILQSTAVQIHEGYSCLSASKPARKGDNFHTCLACPPGMYHEDSTCKPCPAGTFNTAYYQQRCLPCPAGTNSKGEGLKFELDCYNWCALYLYSDSGLTPCTDCPKDTYWEDRPDKSTCVHCPLNTNTNGRGGRKPEDCLAHCQPGFYSATGLEPCKACPLHYFQADKKATKCTPCPSNTVTKSVMSTSQQDCVDGSTLVCSSQPCKNGGVCEVRRHDFFCSCPDGYTGATCETEVTPCDLSPCINGGSCRNIDLTRYHCSCPALYSGEQCEIDGNQCSDDTCANNGTCIDQKLGTLCTCPSYSGYYGSSCQFPQIPCVKNPCLNGGQCVAKNNYYRLCQCAEGFSGIDCEIDLDECTPDLCMNGGTCVDGPNSFTCHCPGGFTGTYCHLRDYDHHCPLGACTGRYCVDNYLADDKYCQCEPGSRYGSIAGDCTAVTECSNVDCGNYGECMSYDDGYHYKCKCSLGYAGTGCDTNVDDCAARPCQNEASCLDGIDDYSCYCVLDGTGGKNCSDNNNGCLNCDSDHTGSCVDTLNGYTCLCLDGYTGVHCETQIPSCASFPCQHNGTCSNPVNSELHACSCLPPWTGRNCELEIDHCASGTVCENGGTCYSTSDGFICRCPSNYKGVRCETEYSLCDVANPCVGNSTCLYNNGEVSCQCRAGYTGQSCEAYICTDTFCRNGGVCYVVENSGTFCDCPAGFTGRKCGINIRECFNNDCPRNAVCVDGIGSYTCVCRDGKIGEDCQKAVSSNFDFVISSPVTCVDSLTYTSYTLNDGTAISVAFWVRHSVLGRPGTILSLYGTTSQEQTRPNTPYHIKINGTHISMMLSTSDAELYKDRFIDGVDIQDGYWHHLVVTWGKTTGELTLFVDGVYNTQASIGRGETLPVFGLLQLGMDKDEVSAGSSSYFVGRISQLLLYDHKLSDPEVDQAFKLEVPDTPRPSILDQDKSIKLQYTIDYSSHLRDRQCFDDKNCDIFDAAALPSVFGCPDDAGLVIDRIASPIWETPEFTPETSLKSNYIPGDTEMTYGSHGIAAAGYDSRGNAAVCSFTLHNRRRSCSSPVASADSYPVCSPIEGEDGSVCRLDCDTDNTSPSQPVSVYQSCSKTGMWDQHERLTGYIYPSCAASSDLTYNITVTLQYATTESCESVSENIITDTTTALKLLNARHSNRLCQFEQGIADVMCSQSTITVTCPETNKAELMITLPWIRGELDSVSVKEILMVALADENRFSFDMYAIPDFQSLDITLTPACKYGTVNIGNRCVVCGSGSYYNEVSLKCVLCPVGTYRQVNTDTQMLSPCTSCPGSETTDTEGSVSRANCHTSCFLGYYYNVKDSSCVACPEGFYQDTRGQSYCQPCPMGQTTYGDGSQTENSCVSISSMTTDVFQTTSTTESPGVLPKAKTVEHLSTDPGVGAATEAGLSTGVVIAIVVLCVIALVAILVLLLICCKERLPCYVEKTTVAPQVSATPWKKVNRYGETNLQYVDYRLSDIKDYKTKALDRIPIYPQNVSPDGSVSADMPVNVPIFTEKLDGRITKKQWLMSTNVRPSEYSDVDQVSERPDSGRPDSLKYNSEKRGPGSHAGSVRTGSERRGPVRQLSSERRGPGSVTELALTGGSVSRQMSFSKRKRPGRPPAVLTAIQLPQMLAPMSHRVEVGPLQPTEEYIRPLPASDRPRQKVMPVDYKEFLESRHRQAHPRPIASSTSIGTSHGSDKILLDSDDDDYR